MASTIEEQIRCVAREIALRRSAYPKWVERKLYGWTKEKAAKEISLMEDVIETLKGVQTK